MEFNPAYTVAVIVCDCNVEAIVIKSSVGQNDDDDRQ